MPRKILLLIIVLFIQKGYAQSNEQKDSLLNKTFDYLEKKIKTNDIDQSLKSAYIDAYLNKAKKEKDTVNIGHGFYHKALYTFYSESDKNNIIGLKYSDSIIYYTNKMDNKTFPGLGYILKGFFNYNLTNEKKALNSYLKAYEYAQIHNNKIQLSDIEDAIHIIKKQGKSTIDDTKNELNSLSKNENDLYNYLIVLGNYVSDLQKAGKYKLADKYTIEGINKSRKLNKKSIYYNFVFISGINCFLKKEYNRAIDSINKAKPELDIKSLSLAYYIKGEIYKAQDTVKAIKYFNKVDSIFQINHTNIYGLFDNYKSLIDIHKTNNNYTKQIEAIDKLIFADSTVNANKIYYEEKILNEYEIPKYKFEKDKIILELKEKNKKGKQSILYLYLVLALVLSFGIYFFKRQRIFKKRYNLLILDNTSKETESISTIDINQKLDISEENISSILLGLETFENAHGFLDNNLNLGNLSKKIETNSSYLSKVINAIKGKSFSSYLNDLRIQYSVEELKSNKVMRKHTIKAIAQDIGFNNSESFSKAFHKKTGIYPSYFIKQLNKDDL